jgi:hypothetical protein
MTLLEITVIVLWLALATAVSLVAGHFVGVPGRLLGFIGTIVAPLLLSRLHAFANQRLLLSPECTPPCICGVSSSALSYEPNPEHRFVERCSCARAYVRRGGRVLLIEPGGARPHLTWVRFRGWRPSAEASTPVNPYR